MRIDEYICNAITRVEQNFNKKYESESGQIIHEMLNGLSTDIINDVVKDIISCNRYLPKPVEWREIIEEHKKEIPTESTGGCALCHGENWLLVGHPKWDEPKAMRCGCRKGDERYMFVHEKGHKRELMAWTDDLIERGFWLAERPRKKETINVK